MKTKSHLILVILFTLFASCTSKPTATLQSNEWILKSLSVAGKQITLPETKPTVFFGDSARISGFSGCNRFFGTYDQKENHVTIKLSGSTMMTCPDIEFEDLFTKQLSEVTTFKFKEKNLILQNKEHNLEMTYTPSSHQE